MVQSRRERPWFAVCIAILCNLHRYDFGHLHRSPMASAWLVYVANVFCMLPSWRMKRYTLSSVVVDGASGSEAQKAPMGRVSG